MIGKRIRNLRDKKGIKQDELAEAIGISTPTLSRYERNETDPTYTVLEKIANALKCDIAEVVSSNYSSHNDLTKNIVIVPIVKFKSLLNKKTPAKIIEEKIGVYPVDISDIEIPTGTTLKICIIEGDAMSPKYYNGDYALFINDSDLSVGDLIVVQFDKKFYIRSYTENVDGTIDLMPESNKYKPIHTSSDDNRYKFIGKVIRVFRTIKNTGFYG